MVDVVMPQLGETVTEGTVTKWLKALGENVARDEPLFEVSTDKVDSEVPSPAAGVLAEILVPEGETVDVGTVLAVVSSDAAATGPSAPAAAPAAAQVTSGPVAVPERGAVAGPAGDRAQAPGTAPAREIPPSDQPAVAAPQPPAGSAQPVTPPVDRTRPAEGAAAGGPAPDGGAQTPAHGSPPGSRILSPVVRRLLEEHGLDVSQVKGTGLGGRVTRSDVLQVIDQRREAGVYGAGPGSPESLRFESPSDGARARAAAGPQTPGAPAEVTILRPGEDEVVPFTNIRRRTAEHMVRSKATSAHTLVVLEADYEQVERVRRTYGRRFKAEEGFSLTYLPFVARATVEALHDWPHLNSSVGDDALIVHHQVNLGIAVDLDHEGLIVPVVHRAEELTLRGLARRIRDLADRARSKRLSADDIYGGTFSITNAGPFGTLLTAPVINQPQVAILSTDAVKRRPVVVAQDDGTEAIAIHSIGLLCLSWDHRAVDGAYASAFVARIADLLSTHDWSAEL